ncbi:hypothetical protein P691DRAFT_786229 [Macrolepiota fuliginosa MF-IS2]|uniref:Uncharacterized protein n=1 Tax=Macrolepiota fuliginosa MF-IS2 TaxID=1400762 RepID=A0A9P6CA64_9AGAR|nr:hypothetical protein P691DRAFT_786229 [Macrolepiota fuliginosa MF-IS2]
MELPPWLQYATAGKELKALTLVVPPAGPETFPALQLALECAKKAISTSTGIQALSETFEPTYLLDGAVVKRAMDEDLRVCVVKWSRTHGGDDRPSSDPFHIPLSKRTDQMAVGNIFVDLEDVHYFLPKGESSDWTKRERKRVVLFSWLVLHAVADALGSILHVRQVVDSTKLVPSSAIAFRVAKRSVLVWPTLKFLGGERNGRFYGNRAWWVEDKLGGMICLFEIENELMIGRPEVQLCFSFTDEMVEDFLSCAPQEGSLGLVLIYVPELDRLMV